MQQSAGGALELATPAFKKFAKDLGERLGREITVEEAKEILEQNAPKKDLYELAKESNIRKGKIKPEEGTIYGNSKYLASGYLPEPSLHGPIEIPTQHDMLEYGTMSKSYIAIKPEHTQEQVQLINDFKRNTSHNLLGFVRKVNGLTDKNVASKLKHKVGSVTERERKEILKLTNVDTAGYTRNLNGSTINHIEKRHGKNGVHDRSMAFDEDVSRMEYVLDNYDNIEPLSKDDIDSDLAKGFFNFSGTNAKSVKYKKKNRWHILCGSSCSRR